MIKTDYKNFEIELFDDLNDDLDLIIKSKNNEIDFGSKKEKLEYISRHYIVVKELGIEISNITIYESNSASGIYEDTFAVTDNKLLVISGNEIYCLEIPSLKLIWHKEFDQAANFALYKLEEDFIIYGEIGIFRITKEGEIVWSFWGRDIWVNLEGKNPFSVENDKIRLFDFESNEYILDFNGNLIEDNPILIPKKSPKKMVVKIWLKPKFYISKIRWLKPTAIQRNY